MILEDHVSSSAVSPTSLVAQARGRLRASSVSLEKSPCLKCRRPGMAGTRDMSTRVSPVWPQIRVSSPRIRSSLSCDSGIPRVPRWIIVTSSAAPPHRAGVGGKGHPSGWCQSRGGMSAGSGRPSGRSRWRRSGTAGPRRHSSFSSSELQCIVCWKMDRNGKRSKCRMTRSLPSGILWKDRPATTPRHCRSLAAVSRGFFLFLRFRAKMLFIKQWLADRWTRLACQRTHLACSRTRLTTPMAAFDLPVDASRLRQQDVQSIQTTWLAAHEMLIFGMAK